MRFLLIILFSISTISVISQQYDWALLDEIEWSDFPDQVSNEVKTEILDSILETSFFKEIGVQYFRESHFHFLDINGDNIPDILFNGHAGSESIQTIIYLNNGGNYDITGNFFGKVIGLGFKDNVLQDLMIENYSCCGGYITHFKKFKFDKDFREFEILEDVAIYEFSDIPDEFMISIPFVTQNEKYRMRSQPIIDNTVYNKGDRPFDAVGNVLAEFPKDSHGIALAERKDETGRVWWFVIMDRISRTSQSVFYSNDIAELPYKKAGWMSSRYLLKE